LSAGDGLVVRARSQVSAMAIHVDRALSLVVERALGEHGSSAVPSGGSFACPRPSGRRPYVINVIPLCRKTSGLGSSTPTCLIVLVDPELQPEPDASVLGRLFGLTKTESEVALHVL